MQSEVGLLNEKDNLMLHFDSLSLSEFAFAFLSVSCVNTPLEKEKLFWISIHTCLQPFLLIKFVFVVNQRPLWTQLPHSWRSNLTFFAPYFEPFAAKNDIQSLSMLDPSKLVLKPDTVSNFDKPQSGIPFRFSPFFPGNYEGRMLKPKSRNPSADGVRPPSFPLADGIFHLRTGGTPPSLADIH